MFQHQTNRSGVRAPQRYDQVTGGIAGVGVVMVRKCTRLVGLGSGSPVFKGVSSEQK